MTSSNPTIGTKVGRARRSFNQLWQVPTFFVGLLAFMGAAASAPWRLTPEVRAYEQAAQVVRRGLADTSVDGDALIGPAETALARANKVPSSKGESHFLMGSVYFRQAQHKPPAYAKELWPRAVDHLDKALALTLSDQDRPRAQYRLGYALYQQGKTPARAVELMTLAMEKGAEQPLIGYQLLMRANLKLDPPNLDGAIAASRRILDVTPETNSEVITQARIVHAELLVRKEAWGEALKVLDAISPTTPRPLRVKARQLQARCCAEEGDWGRAVPIWKELLSDASLVEGGRARIYYAIGLCYRQMDPPNGPEAIDAWSKAIKSGLDAGKSAGQAAGLRLGDYRLTLKSAEEIRLALDEWKQAMENVTTAAEFNNPYISREQVIEMFTLALKKFQSDQELEKAQEVAGLFRKLAGEAADKEVADSAEALARQMRAQLDEKADAGELEKVIAQFRRAGEAHEQAAQTRTATDKSYSLWRAAQCQLAAKETKRAEDLIRKFVTIETKESNLAEGWYTLGDLCRLHKNDENARKAYVKCLDYPDTPFAYRARNFLAADEIDKQKYAQAKSILDQNLVVASSKIDRASREKTHFLMTRVLLKMKNHADARKYLSAFISDFPENPNVIVARVQLGECHRELAKHVLGAEKLAEQRVETAGSIEIKQQAEEERRHHRIVRLQHLTDAISSYQALTESLRVRERERPLDNNEQMLLRRAKFGIGECHFDSEEFAQGLREFQRLQSQHRQTVEGFWASLRICNLAEVLKAEQHRTLGRDSVRMLMDDLKVMSKDHEVFRTPGVATRDEWQNWAEKMEVTLTLPPKVDRAPTVFP